jgi:hypothetical protein
LDLCESIWWKWSIQYRESMPNPSKRITGPGTERGEKWFWSIRSVIKPNLIVHHFLRVFGESDTTVLSENPILRGRRVSVVDWLDIAGVISPWNEMFQTIICWNSCKYYDLRYLFIFRVGRFHDKQDLQEILLHRDCMKKLRVITSLF